MTWSRQSGDGTCRVPVDSGPAALAGPAIARAMTTASARDPTHPGANITLARISAPPSAFGRGARPLRQATIPRGKRLHRALHARRLHEYVCKENFAGMATTTIALRCRTHV